MQARHFVMLQIDHARHFEHLDLVFGLKKAELVALEYEVSPVEHAGLLLFQRAAAGGRFVQVAAQRQRLAPRLRLGRGWELPHLGFVLTNWGFDFELIENAWRLSLFGAQPQQDLRVEELDASHVAGVLLRVIKNAQFLLGSLIPLSQPAIDGEDFEVVRANCVAEKDEADEQAGEDGELEQAHGGGRDDEKRERDVEVLARLDVRQLQSPHRFVDGAAAGTHQEGHPRLDRGVAGEVDDPYRGGERDGIGSGDDERAQYRYPQDGVDLLDRKDRVGLQHREAKPRNERRLRCQCFDGGNACIETTAHQLQPLVSDRLVSIVVLVRDKSSGFIFIYNGCHFAVEFTWHPKCKSIPQSDETPANCTAI
mmetsp:Transcript_5757/g.12572  ORF Transcript_5757/g.12572 Transcript_5757/m.12572 type:complete len:367 (+) Transcript_5757:985-2085(+)